MFDTACSFAGIAFLRSCSLCISASWRDVEEVTAARRTDLVLTLMFLSPLLCRPGDLAAAWMLHTDAIKTSHLTAGGGIKPYKLLLPCSVQCRKLRGLDVISTSKTPQKYVQCVDRGTRETDGHIAHSWSVHGPDQCSPLCRSWRKALYTKLLLSHLV